MEFEGIRELWADVIFLSIALAYAEDDNRPKWWWSRRRRIAARSRVATARVQYEEAQERFASYVRTLRDSGAFRVVVP